MSTPNKPNTEACHLLVKLDGSETVKATSTKDWSTRAGLNVVSIIVDQRLDAPDSFELRFIGSHEGEQTVFDLAKEGATVELGFGYESPEIVFKGEVIYVEVEFDPEQGSTVTLRGYDHSHRLTRGFSAKSFGTGDSADQEMSALVSEVIEKSQALHGEKSDGLAPDQMDSTDFKTKWIPKAMSTDYDFIKWAGSSLARASDAGREDDKKISFHKLDVNSNPVATVCLDKAQSEAGSPSLSTQRARFQINTYPCYAKVRVHGWNSAEKKAFVGEVTQCSQEIDCSTTNDGWKSGWKNVGKALWADEAAGAVYEQTMDYCESQEEADKIAQGLFDSFSLRYLTGEIDATGLADIVPGSVVALKGFGDRVSGKVLVTEATHHISAKEGQPYTTSFRFVSNAAKPPE
ncbi:MAG: phage protein D [Myxococcota bacterium]|jgi:phage protein D